MRRQVPTLPISNLCTSCAVDVVNIQMYIFVPFLYHCVMPKEVSTFISVRRCNIFLPAFGNDQSYVFKIHKIFYPITFFILPLQYENVQAFCNRINHEVRREEESKKMKKMTERIELYDWPEIPPGGTGCDEVKKVKINK